MRVGLGAGFNSLHQLGLGFLVAMIGLVVLMLTRCASMRLTSSVVFVFPSLPFLGSYLAICHLLSPN